VSNVTSGYKNLLIVESVEYRAPSIK